MGNGFHFAVIQQKSSLHQGFTISGGAGADDFYSLGKEGIDLLQRGDGSRQRTAAVVAVKRVQQGTVLTHQCNLRGGGAGVNAKERIPFVF